jgi:hypothetical protein
MSQSVVPVVNSGLSGKVWVTSPGFAQPRRLPGMGAKWEYNWMNTGWYNDANTVLAGAMTQANYLGEYGWELIAFQMLEKGDQVSIVAMLKRLKTPSEEALSPVRALEDADGSMGPAEGLLSAAKTATGRSRSKGRKGIRSK